MDDDVDTKYHPQHPLPAEIREMGRDSTVCQFCGVSYLILNEIKNLQEELDKCKEEVERLKHFDAREKTLNDQVNSLNMKTNELLEKWQFEEKRNNEYEDLILQKNVHISQLKNNFEKSAEDLYSEKTHNETLKRQLKEVACIAGKIGISRKVLYEELSKTYRFFQYEVFEFSNHWNKQKAAVLEEVTHLCNIKNKSEEECNQCKIEIGAAKAKYEHQKTILDKCLLHIKEYQRKMEQCNSRFNAFEKKQSMLLEMYQKRLLNLNNKLHKLGIYFKSVSKCSSDSVEKYKQENILLKDERTRTVNAHQHQIKQLNDSFKEKLLEANGHSTKVDENLKDLECKLNEEKRLLLEEHTESLNKVTTENKAKYKLLNDSNEQYKREIKKLDEKLKFQKKKFTEEKSNLLKEVTESYEKATVETEARFNEMNEEKENNMNTIRKLEQQLESMQVKFHEEMLKQVQLHEREKKNMEHQISELSKNLRQKQENNAVNERKEKLTRTIEDLQSALTNAKEVIKEKSYTIDEFKDEISSLRDCVRRECEERYELTEALAEARTELLSQQRFNNSPKQLLSHPLIYNQKSPSGNKLRELPKSHEKLVKLEEISNSSSNMDESKFSQGNLSTSHSKSGSLKSQNSGSSSTSRYSKSKLMISLKNR